MKEYREDAWRIWRTYHLDIFGIYYVTGSDDAIKRLPRVHAEGL